MAYATYRGKILNGNPTILENITDFQTDEVLKAKAIDALDGIIPVDFKFSLEDIRRERIENEV